MRLALWLVVAAGVLHVTEEYLWPGGFLEAMRRVAPGYAFAVNPMMAVVINGLMFLVLLTAPFAAETAPMYALSAAGLVAVNGWSHLAGTMRRRRYLPGVATGLLLYQPVAVLAYLEFARAGLSRPLLAGSLLLGAAYHLVPLGYIAVRRSTRARAGAAGHSNTSDDRPPERDRLTPVEIRGTWPSDFTEVLRLHEAMSPASRRLRFFTDSRAPGRETAHRISNESAPGYLALAATHGGRIIGVAELARNADTPEQATVSFLVEDRYQGRGVGSLLLTRLVDEARKRGVRTLIAHVLPDNHAALKLFTHTGPATQTSPHQGALHLRMDLPPNPHEPQPTTPPPNPEHTPTADPRHAPKPPKP